MAAHETLTCNAAIVHDWYPGIAGGEKVAMHMAGLFGTATIYTLFDFLSPEERNYISAGHPIEASSLNRLPGVKRYYRYLVLAATRAVERFDMSAHDVVLSSTSAFAKGVITGPDQPHIAYIHSPPRYAWDLTHEYINGLGGILGGAKRAIAHRMMHKMRIWDLRTVPSVDHFVANSKFIAKRIWKLYRREAAVVYPPVDTEAFGISEGPREDYYVTVSRLVSYKRVKLIAEAFTARPKLRLKIIGDGPEMAAIKAVAGPNVELLGHLPGETMREHLQKARAFVFAALEDFGISPVEAQASGTPVIALGLAGTAETVIPLGLENATGVWFQEQTVPSLLDAIDRFEAEGQSIDPKDCRAHAVGFGVERFHNEMRALTERALAGDVVA